MNLGWKLFALESSWATLRPTRIAGSIMGVHETLLRPIDTPKAGKSSGILSNLMALFAGAGAIF
jgi:hypothetical protein